MGVRKKELHINEYSGGQKELRLKPSNFSTAGLSNIIRWQISRLEPTEILFLQGGKIRNISSKDLRGNKGAKPLALELFIKETVRRLSDADEMILRFDLTPNSSTV